MKIFKPGEIPAETLEMIAARFKALSEPNRLRLIIALKERPLHVGELAVQTGLTQANVSRHLQQLLGAGLLGRRKEGLHAIYFIADHGIFELCERVCAGVEKRLQAQAQAAAWPGK